MLTHPTFGRYYKIEIAKLIFEEFESLIFEIISPINIDAEELFVSSDRSSYSDDGLLYIYPRQLFQIFTQSLDAIDVTSVTLSRLNSINAIDVTRC